MKQERASNTDIAEYVFREIGTELWNDGRRWWYRHNGRWISGHEASGLIHDRLRDTPFPDDSYWERGPRILDATWGRYTILRFMFRMLRKPADIPEHPTRPGWRTR